jgi:hypothetical protein
MSTISGGSIVWDLDVEASKLTAGLNEAKSKVDDVANKTQSSFSNIGNSIVSSFQGIVSKVGGGLTEIGNLAVSKLGLIGGGGLAALGTAAAFSASRVDELTLALHAIGKANNIAATETDKAVEALRKNNIAYSDALQVTSRFIQNELDLTDAVKLSNAAKDLAVIAGLGSSEATNILTEAISGQSVMMLRQFGIVTGLDEAYEKYANSITGTSVATQVDSKKTQANIDKLAKLKDQLEVAKMKMGEFSDEVKESTKVSAQNRIDDLTNQIAGLEGKTTAYAKATGNVSDNLTQAQKKQALLNVILEAGTKVTGTYDAAMESSGKQFRSLTTRIIPDFMVQIGRAFEPTLALAVNKISEAIKDMGKWLDDNKQIVADWGTKLSKVFGKVIDGIFKIVDFLIKNKEIVVGMLVAVGLGIAAVAVGFVLAHGVALLVFAAITALVTIFLKLGPVLEAVGGFFIDLWNGIGNAFVYGWKAIVNFITKSIPNLIGNIIKWFMELPGKILDFFGFLLLSFVTGLGLIVGLFVYGVPKLINDIVKWFSELPSKLMDIWNNIVENFKKGWENIVNFFTIKVPEIVVNIGKWFAELPGKIWNSMVDTKNRAVEGIKNIWTSLINEVSSWPNRMYNWGVNLINSFIDGIKSALRNIADSFKSGMEAAKRLIEGHSPPLAGPFKDIDKWGFNIGDSWVQGFKNAVAGLSSANIGIPDLSGLQGQPAPALANGGNIGRNGGFNQNIDINIEKVENKEDIAAIGRELGYRASLML